MLKKIIISFLFLLIGYIGFSQVVVQPVTVVTESLATLRDRIEQFNDRVIMIRNLVNQVQLLNSIVQNQIRSVEQLKEGDWQGIVYAYSYQAESIRDFSDFLDNLDYFDDIQFLQDIMRNDEYNAFHTDISCLADSMYATNSFLFKTLNLVNNTEYRLRRYQTIQEQSQSSDSLIEQLQLNNQSLGLLSQEIGDVLLASTALNAAIATEMANEQIKNEIQQQQATAIIHTDEDNDIYESDVSMLEFKNALLGYHVVPEN
jgi:hypothetical protein